VLPYVSIFTGLNRTKNFDSHDPYHPYHPYFNLDSSTNPGKDRKGGRDGMFQSFRTPIHILAQRIEPLALWMLPDLSCAAMW
jgi:hypothetical protein